MKRIVQDVPLIILFYEYVDIVIEFPNKVLHVCLVIQDNFNMLRRSLDVAWFQVRVDNYTTYSF